MIEGHYRAKVIGNGLRELDRFLNLLVHALVMAYGVALPGDERNTANKVARLRALAGLADPDHARLAALARMRDCLFHCGGRVRRGDRRGDPAMTTGCLNGATLRRVGMGEELRVSARELREICLYYCDLAERLSRELGAASAAIHSRNAAIAGPGVRDWSQVSQ